MKSPKYFEKGEKGRWGWEYNGGGKLVQVHVSMEISQCISLMVSIYNKSKIKIEIKN
jgi:hypothetical protein